MKISIPFNRAYLPQASAISALLLSYLSLRIVFQQGEITKQAFIFPTGWLVKLFYGHGQYEFGEWYFNIGHSPFTLGESCSGTTFFSLLTAFFIFKGIRQPRWLAYLILAYPITLIANTTRVLSVISTHNTLDLLQLSEYGQTLHIVVGTMTFLSFLFASVLLLEKRS